MHELPGPPLPSRSIRRHGLPPLVPRAMRRRPGLDGPGAAPRRGRVRGATLRRRPPRASIRWRPRRPLRAQGQAGHLPVHGRRRRATSSCSTTSPSSRSSTARCRRPSCSRATAPRSSIPTSKLLGPKFKFARHGQCGTELSELLPHLADGRRRHRHHQGHVHRRLQPRAGADHDEHRRA